MKKEKFNLNDILWAYSNDGQFVAPIIVNLDKNKIKNLVTGDIFRGNFSDDYLKAISELYTRESGKEIMTTDSPHILKKFGIGIHNAQSCLTLFMLNAMSNSFFHDTVLYFRVHNFCEYRQISLPELKRLTSALSNSISRKQQRDFDVQARQEDYLNQFSF